MGACVPNYHPSPGVWRSMIADSLCKTHIGVSTMRAPPTESANKYSKFHYSSPPLNTDAHQARPNRKMILYYEPRPSCGAAEVYSERGFSHSSWNTDIRINKVILNIFPERGAFPSKLHFRKCAHCKIATESATPLCYSLEAAQ